jgi:3-oxoacyl-[acyl-carrier protein] reductase
MNGLLEGKVAVVAGGGRGIGEATSRRLAEAGACVMVVDKAADRAHRVVADIVAAGGRAWSLVADLRDDGTAGRVLGEVGDRHGALDVLVNVAGGMRPSAAWRPLRELDPDDWDAVFDQNIRWVYRLSVAAADQMAAQDAGGSVVSISSISGVFGAPNHAAYGAAKAGLISLSKSLALEYGRQGVRFNVVSPGSVRTPAVEDLLTAEQRERDEITTPLHRTGRPDDIAGAVLFFASELSSFVSGQMLLVDGGASVRFPLPSPGADPSESLV